MVYEDFEMGGQRIRGPFLSLSFSFLSKESRVKREGVRVYSFYGGTSHPPPPCPLLVASFYAGYGEWRF